MSTSKSPAIILSRLLGFALVSGRTDAELLAPDHPTYKTPAGTPDHCWFALFE